MMEKISIFTRSLGCPKNLVDTEKILGALGSIYQPATSPSASRVVLINTCAFITPAVEESLEVIFSTWEEIKDLENRPLLVVTGCLVSRYGRELHAQIPETDIFATIKDQKSLPALILKKLGVKQQANSLDRRISTPRSYAYLKISEGCSNRCSFCTIPSIRGRLRSRKPDQVLEEASILADRGIQELIIVAQDSTAYGRDLGYGPGLAGLVRKLSSIQGLKRLRVMYMYPSGLSLRLLEALAETGPPFIPYFDVPFQHSHPSILKRMGRPFSEDPRIIIARIRRVFPGAAIRTTLIAGFPGETQELFSHLQQFVRDSRIQHLGVFPFHPEEGSRAAGFPEQVPQKVRLSRVRKIMNLQRAVSRAYLKSFQGKLVDVLVDSAHSEWPGLFTGRTWFQSPDIDGMTYISGPDAAPGALVRGRVQETADYDLTVLQE